MLARKNRLRTTKEIMTVYQARKVLSSENFRINFDFTAESGPQFTVVAGKQVGKAHDRNLIKRRIRAIFRDTPLFKLETLRIVVTIKKTAVNLEFGQVETEVKELLGRIKY